MKFLDFVKMSGIPIQNDKIVIPSWVTSVKIDVGMSYDAPHTQNWIDADPGTIVFGFEANPRWLNYITTPPGSRDYSFKDYIPARPPPYKELLFENVGKRCFVIPVAIGCVSEPTTMDFYITEISEGCCSLLPPKTEFSSVSEVVKVPVFNLSDFLDLLPDGQIVDFLKIDIQGADIQALRGANTRLTDRVVFVTAEPEVEQYQNSHDNTPQNMGLLMDSLGFDRVWHSNTKDPTFLNRKYKNHSNTYIFQYF
jgi:FkbM family methyltransferase